MQERGVLEVPRPRAGHVADVDVAEVRDCTQRLRQVALVEEPPAELGRLPEQVPLPDRADELHFGRAHRDGDVFRQSWVERSDDAFVQHPG